MDGLLEQLAGVLHYGWVALVALAAVILVATYLASRLAAKYLRAALQSESTLLPANSIFINVVRATIWIVGICVILAVCLGINVGGVIAALGIGGIALSLGFQDTISNLVGGLQVSLMKLLKPGDHIQVGADAGVVKDVTWRHTSITNALGQTVMVPNAFINKTTLIKLAPVGHLTLPFAVSLARAGKGAQLDALAESLEKACARAAAPLSEVTSAPRAFFTEIDSGFLKGKVVLSIADAECAGRVSDAALRLMTALLVP